MNLSNSECSSGCESGWTMYFDQHSESHQGQYNRNDEEETLRSKREHINDDYIEEQESEDLSMVSDASSGPPHLHEDEKCYVRNEYISYLSDKPEENQKKVKGLKREEKSHLDDTASSPVGAFSKACYITLLNIIIKNSKRNMFWQHLYQFHFLSFLLAAPI
ncbi:hypothetical protein Leryth_012335 [Lithospermum erythrorhizon]|nr:hypothetical protein Leryth_012335 [Lithospermum erythrorhizon]